MARRRTLRGAEGAHPAIGAVVGAGTQSIGAIGFRAFVGKDKYSELVGVGIGALASGALWATGHREAGATGLASAIAAGLIRTAACMIGCKEQVRDYAGEMVTIKGAPPCKDQLAAMKAQATAAGLGIVSPYNVPAFQGGSPLGIPSAHQVPAFGLVQPESAVAFQGLEGGASALGQAQKPGVQLVGAGFGSTVLG